MATQTSSSGVPTPPVIKGGEEVYNMIMGEIEQDLLSQNLPNIDAKYAGESAEQKGKRMERYKKAFAEYQKKYAAYRDAQKGAVRSFGLSLVKSIEKSASAVDASVMDAIESAISQA